MKAPVAANVDEYIKGFPTEVQALLQEVRTTVKAAAPTAEETIKYAMPTYMLNGNLVYFAAFKNHIGFYPAPTNDARFTKALAPYKTGKGSVQFPIDKPMPVALITKIVQLRIKQNAEKQQAKQKK